ASGYVSKTRRPTRRPGVRRARPASPATCRPASTCPRLAACVAPRLRGRGRRSLTVLQTKARLAGPKVEKLGRALARPVRAGGTVQSTSHRTRHPEESRGGEARSRG